MSSNGEVLILVEIESVIDQRELQAYQSAARQQLKERGEKVLGRGGGTFEGDRPHGPLLVQLWPSMSDPVFLCLDHLSFASTLLRRLDGRIAPPP
jgi:uncharacterized protein (DUF1330 family)